MKLSQLFETIPQTQDEYERANAVGDAEDKKRLQHALDQALLDGDDQLADELRAVLKDTQ